MFDTLAKMLGIPVRAVEDAMGSEKLAQTHLSRRTLMGGGLALLTGKAFGIPIPFVTTPIDTVLATYPTVSIADMFRSIPTRIVFPLFEQAPRSIRYLAHIERVIAYSKEDLTKVTDYPDIPVLMDS